MKKLLLLGGSMQQVVAIEKAKELGYYTVLCDFLPDNPGQYASDKFYLVSTTDKEAVLEAAKKENIDGVVAYASDPAAPTAAYVAEKLALPGNPYESVEILCNKDKFRKFLKENGFCTPKAKGYADILEAQEDVESDLYTLPVIVKPVDSSGSKGVRVAYKKNELASAIEFAFSYSRSSRIIIEEFIEKKHKYLIGGDIFVLNGEVVLWGLLNCHRDTEVNPLVPVGKSYPVELEKADVDVVKQTLKSIADKLQIKNCAMNVELVVDRNNRVFPVDVGPRSGGNMIPDLLGDIFGVDVVEMTIKSAMGEAVSIDIKDSGKYFATHNLHTNKTGILKEIVFSDQVEKYITKKCIYVNSGAQVEYFDNSSKALGIVFLKFDEKEQMDNILENINEHILIETV